VISEEQPESPDESAQSEDGREDAGQKTDGEGAGPAEDLETDPAYSPKGPERKYKGG
jgi:hypothetical protein